MDNVFKKQGDKVNQWTLNMSQKTNTFLAPVDLINRRLEEPIVDETGH